MAMGLTEEDIPVDVIEYWILAWQEVYPDNECLVLHNTVLSLYEWLIRQSAKDSSGGGKVKEKEGLAEIELDRYNKSVDWEKALEDYLKAPWLAFPFCKEELAKGIINLPKELGEHPESGDIIKADTGRYGPYIRCGKTTSSINLPDSILDLELQRAVEILSTEGKKSGPQVIKELGIDPETKAPIEIKDGRYGIYVTNGKINATLPKATPADDITLEIAVQLIADKKAKGPVRKKYFKRKS